MSTQMRMNPEELQRIGLRVESALKRRPLLPFSSLQYRLGEVGKSRVHPYELQQALTMLRRTPSARGTTGTSTRPWEVLPHLYASQELDTREARNLAAAHRIELDRLATSEWDRSLEGLISALATVLPGIALMPEAPPSKQAVLAETRFIQGRSDVFRLTYAGRELRVWLTQEADWVGPTDSRLWAFLIRCLDDDARPLVIARYVDPATFVLFRALNVRALQYYCLWAPPAEAEDLARISEGLGWFNIKPSHKAEDHRILAQVPNARDHLGQTTWDVAARDSLRLAQSIGLAEPHAVITPRLLEWARGASLELPDYWIDTLGRWSARPKEELPASGLKKDVRSRSPKANPLKPSVKESKNHPPQQAEKSEAAEKQGFGRETTVSRIPIRGW